MARMTSKQILSELPLFSGLDHQEIASLCSVSMIKNYRKGSLIFIQGDIGDGLYLLLSGEVKITLLGSDGKEYILGFLRPGFSFGESALLKPRPRYSSVIATLESRFLVIHQKAFLQCVTHTSSILANLMDGLYKRLASVGEMLTDMAFLNVHARISKVLFALGHTIGTPSPSGDIVLPKMPTQKDFAAMAGTTRETVSRVLNDLKNHGYISGTGRKIVIRKGLLKYLEGLSMDKTSKESPKHLRTRRTR